MIVVSLFANTVLISPWDATYNDVLSDFGCSVLWAELRCKTGEGDATFATYTQTFCATKASIRKT